MGRTFAAYTTDGYMYPGSHHTGRVSPFPETSEWHSLGDVVIILRADPVTLRANQASGRKHLWKYRRTLIALRCLF